MTQNHLILTDSGETKGFKVNASNFRKSKSLIALLGGHAFLFSHEMSGFQSQMGNDAKQIMLMLGESSVQCQSYTGAFTFSAFLVFKSF